MKILSEKRALENLAEIRSDLSGRIRKDYEHAAQSCSTCSTPGACCLDAHFVNVRISRLEAVAIGEVIRQLSPAESASVAARVDAAIVEYELDPAYDSIQAFACPLFEKGIGCLVHNEAKPLPCIQHACYENAADLPPDELLDAAETAVDALSRRVYRGSQPILPLPLAVRQFGRIR